MSPIRRTAKCITMNQHNNKFSQFFSPRNIISVICISLLNSCVSPTYPVSTHYTQPTRTTHTSNLALPILAGAATIGAIAYGKKKHDNHRKRRLKTKHDIKQSYNAYPYKSSFHSKPVVKKPNRSTYRSKNTRVSTRNASNKRVAKPIKTKQLQSDTNRTTIRHAERSNQRSNNLSRQQIIERTREQLQQRGNRSSKVKDRDRATNEKPTREIRRQNQG